MSLVVDATYENGTLKLDKPLPLPEHQRVKVTVEPEASRVDLTYGLIGWTGDPEVLRKIAEDDEFGILESRRASTIDPFAGSVPVSKERQEALRALIGMWKTEQPPDDEEVERIIEQERMKKYG